MRTRRGVTDQLKKKRKGKETNSKSMGYLTIGPVRSKNRAILSCAILATVSVGMATRPASDEARVPVSFHRPSNAPHVGRTEQREGKVWVRCCLDQEDGEKKNTEEKYRP